MSESSEDEGGEVQGDGDDTNAIQQVGELVSMIMNSIPDVSISMEAGAPEPLPPLDAFPSPSGQPPTRCDPGSCPNSFITEARSLFSYYQHCLKLIEASSSSGFADWGWLDECMERMASHPRVSDKMKMRYFLHNKDNAKTFRLIQKSFKLKLDEQFYMGKMNLLHIACDSGWANLARELVLVEGMDVNLPCPSVNMRPGNLTPLMLATGAGHRSVVEVLVLREDINLEQKDKEGFTAIFHACNHGTNRVGDQHGYFRRLWSWDLSEEQLNSMERLARENSKDILRTLIIHGSDLNARDNTGATVLYRASTVENFQDVIRFLVEVGCRITQNNLSWIKIKNPDLTEFVESELQNPKSLVRLSRLVTWKCLRSSGSEKKFTTKLDSLGENHCIPLVLVDYLNCR
jgi:hypothetical protein